MISPSFTVWPPPVPVAAGPVLAGPVLAPLLGLLLLPHAPSAVARAIVATTAMIRVLISPPARNRPLCRRRRPGGRRRRGPGPRRPPAAARPTAGRPRRRGRAAGPAGAG